MRTENHVPGPAAIPAGRALNQGALRQVIVGPRRLWRELEVVGVTGSTNADLLARAADGAPEGTVLAAEEQRAGRGRLGRAWVSPPRAALMFSVLLRPGTVPPARLGWLPLLTGVAVTSAVRAVTAVDAQLKWPNDVLVGASKLGGILAEASGGAVVVGIGLNVSTEPDELPPPAPAPTARSPRPRCAPKAGRARTGTSCSPPCWASSSAGTWPGATPGETPSAAGWPRSTLGCAPRSAARSGWSCPVVTSSMGLAAGIDPAGRLLVRVPDGELPVAAGDVVHVR